MSRDKSFVESFIQIIRLLVFCTCTHINVCINILCCVKYLYNISIQCLTSIVHSLFLSLDGGTISQYCCTIYQYCCTVSVLFVLLYCCITVSGLLYYITVFSTVVLCYCHSTVVLLSQCCCTVFSTVVLLSQYCCTVLLPQYCCCLGSWRDKE